MELLNVSIFGFCILGAWVVYHCVWLAFFDPLRHIPGPWTTRVSSLWLTLQCRIGRRSQKVHELHQRYGDVVRIAVDHVSINRPEAIQEIYVHDREYRKGPWYQMLETPMPPLITTYDPDEHAQQRKNLNPAFSARALREFEPDMDQTYLEWKKKLMELLVDTPQAEIDATKWADWLAFDLIGRFSFGVPFGFVEKGQDFMRLADLMEKRLRTTTAYGVLPLWVRPYMPWFPFDSFWRAPVKCILDIRAFVRRAYEQRLASGEERKDLLSHLLAAKSEGGNSLSEGRMLSNMTAMVIAGSDSTAASTVHFIDFVSRDAELQQRIHEEIDNTFPGIPDETWVPSYADAQKLTFTIAVLYEVLRLRPTAGLGLERYAVQKHATFAGHTIPPKTFLSVPTYSVHRDPEIYPDPDTFNPQRWLAADTTAQHKYFNVFSQGPRSCIGQSFAWMEMLKSIALLFKLFHFTRVTEEQTELREGFFIKAIECRVALSQRV